ncbi:MAG: thioredoxin domain-containing protein, partial [Ignavibacteriales bacterium]|nr:thioredoxin domain-containing protein [Ignavibacteriales bacterium]
GFYSAEDAESALDVHNPAEKEEGAFYVWTKGEIDRILSDKESEIFNRYYDIQNDGNVLADPHGVFKGKNILHVVYSAEEVTKQFSSAADEIEQTLNHAKEKIFKARENRPRPHLDDKILVSWNGMMISAFARAHQVLQNDHYLEIAERAAHFILDRLADRSSGQLLRRYRDGEARFEAHLEDYAFLIQALIDLYEASSTIEYLQTALTFTERQNQLFYDQEQGGLFDISGNDKTILIRTKEWYDGAEPTGNSIAILNLFRLSQMTNNQAYAEMATKSVEFFSERLLTMPNATPQFLVALNFSLSKPKQIIIAGNPNDPLTTSLLGEVHSRFIPNKIILFADGKEGQTMLASFVPFLENVQPIGGKPTAYICEDYACQLPTSDSATIERLLST